MCRTRYTPKLRAIAFQVPRVLQGLKGQLVKLGYKVREAELLKTPYMLVAGRREAEGNSFSVRNFSVGDRGAIGVDEIEAELLHKVATREFDVKLKTISWSHEEETETDESGY